MVTAIKERFEIATYKRVCETNDQNRVRLVTDVTRVDDPVL